MFNKNSSRLYLCILMLCLACNTSTAWADFSGNWLGSWTSINSTAGRLEATMMQSGVAINGTLNIFSTDCGDLHDLPLSGNVTGSQASFYTSVSCGGSFNELYFSNGILAGNTITGTYTIQADGDYWDSGTFRLDRVCCTITASAGAGGTINPSGAVTLVPGASQTFNINSFAGYVIADVAVDNLSQGPVSTYTFSNIQGNSIITATFKQDCCTITATAGVGGSINPDGAVAVAYGGSQTFIITSDSGFLIDDVMVDNESKGVITSYMFTNVDSDHTISASFAKPEKLLFIPILLDD